MKYVLYITVFLFIGVLQSKAQNVGIGTNTPNSSAALEISSADKGLLIPRTSTVGRNAITSPSKGLMVYDTTHSVFFYYDGGTWRPIYEKNYDSTTLDYSATPTSNINLPLTGFSVISHLVNNGYIFDNGGPSANYTNNSNSGIDISNDDSTLAVKIIIEEMNIETFHDSLFIINLPSGLPADTIARLTGTQVGTYFINSMGEYSSIRINLKSDNAVNLSGFKIRWGRIRSSGNLQIAVPLYGWYFDNKKIAAMGGIQKNNNWNTDSIGFGSFSYGIGNKSSGVSSTAMGYGTSASGIYSTAMGESTKASDYSTAIGSGTSASGNTSTAMGYGTIASGVVSTAMGYLTTAIGDYSTAMGNSTIASGNSSTAMGNETTASGFNSTAMGNTTIASGKYSTAMGYTTIASRDYSTAMGYLVEANGFYSTAMGTQTTANGFYSTAMGNITTASGDASTAMGQSTTASGNTSTAMGYFTTASGIGSTATGNITIASGLGSTAMGNYVSTNSHEGSFAIGDNSTTVIMNTFEDNAFRARFANGYRLFTNSACTIGAYLNQNANSWATLSDKRRKEKFEPVNGEYFLQQISSMPLTTWNYIGQDSKTLRHYGPMAQDFYAAFGKDKLGTIGCDTLINQQDFLGVNLIAIQALEKRTANLQKENDQIKNKNKELIKLVQEIRKELDELKGK